MNEKAMHKTNKNNIISLKGYPSDHAFKAYEEGYYFEAVAVLHGFIEGQMKSLFHLHAITICKTSISDTWDVNDKISYIMLAHVLFVSNLINRNQYDILISFNSVRNELMHRFYLDKYDKDSKGLSKAKLSSCFKPAYNLLYEIMEKADNLM
ncbi:hypothetical protein [Flavobacterium johnsoniae]|nr:hypothetical protein [Flavobacterium johnsoniae]OXE95269.1 hypothetical protein B0A63_25190 [Flavobacterium johnsoniae UW101]WQG82460.1 hypothetical protein SR927_04935 [Flavobacterium johnsoniae UW101]SHM01953.1 hypothetical protein SAMN05444146_5198 [Flavobacterium johnsoniae]